MPSPVALGGLDQGQPIDGQVAIQMRPRVLNQRHPRHDDPQKRCHSASQGHRAALAFRETSSLASSTAFTALRPSNQAARPTGPAPSPGSRARTSPKYGPTAALPGSTACAGCKTEPRFPDHRRSATTARAGNTRSRRLAELLAARLPRAPPPPDGLPASRYPPASWSRYCGTSPSPRES